MREPSPKGGLQPQNKPESTGTQYFSLNKFILVFPLICAQIAYWLKNEYFANRFIKNCFCVPVNMVVHFAGGYRLAIISWLNVWTKEKDGADGTLEIAKVNAKCEYADLDKCIKSTGDTTFCCDILDEYKEDGICCFSNEACSALFRYMKRFHWAKTVRSGEWFTFFYPAKAEVEFRGKLPANFVEKVFLPRGYYLPSHYYECGTYDGTSIEYEIPNTFEVTERIQLQIWT